MERLLEVPDRETGRTSARDEFRNKLIQLALTLGIVASGRDFQRPVRDKRPRPLLRVKNAANLHLAICPRHGIRIDRQIHRDPANRRQLIAGTQVAGGHRGENLVDELPINRDTAVGIEVESEDGEMGIECHVEQCTS
jgi:hypothetical protein